MKAVITGSSGFIGSNFIRLFSSKFSHCVKLTSSSAKDAESVLYSLTDLDSIVMATKGADFFIHCAFDHSYKDNVSGIKNIIQACKINRIGRLIYLSSVSVYDPKSVGYISEVSDYSKLNDPYSREKIKIEDILQESQLDNVIILQPSIVYGFGGNWTQYAFNVAKSGRLSLPNNGICNSVYVDDVCESIYLACNVPSHGGAKKYLISGVESSSWSDFYMGHDHICSAMAKWQDSLQILKFDLKEFHNKKLINFTFAIWYYSPLGNIANYFISILKGYRAKKYLSVNKKNEFEKLADHDRSYAEIVPIGINRVVHNCRFKVNINNAAQDLGYTPSFDLEKGLQKIKIELLGL